MMVMWVCEREKNGQKMVKGMKTQRPFRGSEQRVGGQEDELMEGTYYSRCLIITRR